MYMYELNSKVIYIFTASNKEVYTNIVGALWTNAYNQHPNIFYTPSQSVYVHTQNLSTISIKLTTTAITKTNYL